MKKFNLKIEGERFEVVVDSVCANKAAVCVNGKAFSVEIEPQNCAQTEDIPATQVKTEPVRTAVTSNEYKVKSPLPGLVIGVKVKEGQSVQEGQVVAVIEAMKMENDIEAERSGIVKSIRVEKGDTVLEGTTLLLIE